MLSSTSVCRSCENTGLPGRHSSKQESWSISPQSKKKKQTQGPASSPVTLLLPPLNPRRSWDWSSPVPSRWGQQKGSTNFREEKTWAMTFCKCFSPAVWQQCPWLCSSANWKPSFCSLCSLAVCPQCTWPVPHASVAWNIAVPSTWTEQVTRSWRWIAPCSAHWTKLHALHLYSSTTLSFQNQPLWAAKLQAN